MSEATLEAPVIESAPNAAPVTPEAAPLGGFTFAGGLEDLIASQNPHKAKTAPKQEKPQHSLPEKQEKAPEVKAEPVKTDVVPVEPVKEPTGIETNLANLRKKAEEASAAREATAKELADLRKSFDDYKSKVPETAAEEAKTWREKHDAAEARRTEQEKELKIASYQRSDEFRTTFQEPIQQKMIAMRDIAIQAGVPAPDAHAAVQRWDQAKFNDWVSDMNPLQQSQFGAAMQGAIELDQRRDAAVKQADQLYDRQQQDKQERMTSTQKQERDQFQKSIGTQAAAVLEQFTQHEAVKANPDLLSAIQQGVRRSNPFEADKFTPKEIMEQIAVNPLLHTMVKTHEKTIEEAQAKIEEQAKKIKEQDEFIQKATGGHPVPGGGNTAAGTAAEPFVEPWKVSVRI